MTTLKSYLEQLEDETIEAKKHWDSFAMHPNDQCEDVLKLLKMIKEYQKWLPEDHSANLECEKILNE